MQKLKWISKQLAMASWFWIVWGEWWSLFCSSHTTSGFDVICYNVVWNSGTVLLGVIWTSLELTYGSSWVTEYHSDVSFLCTPCRSRHRVYLQCHCQLKPKTGGRCTDAAQRVDTIFFSSKTHIGNRCLLWELPEKCLPLWVLANPTQENPGTERGKYNAEIRHRLSLWFFLRWARRVDQWRFSPAWRSSAPSPN